MIQQKLTEKLVVLLCVGLLAACNARTPSASSTAESAQSASAASSSTAQGSCGEFVSKLCLKSGDQSPSCQAAKELGELLPASACNAATKDFEHVAKAFEAKRKVCDALADRLCNDLGAETDSCKMVRDQTPKFPNERCQQLTKEYDKVLAELKEQEAQNQPLSSELSARIAASDAPGFGPADAKVTIVEFSDFQCPYCSRAADVVSQIKSKYAGKVRFVFRQFPLSFHQQAYLAAQASLAAHQQGKFWEYHDLLFQNQSNLTRESLEQYAKDAKLDVEALKKALDASTHKAAVDADLELGKAVSVSGTPTVFINGKRVPNPTQFEPVAKLIDDALGA